MWTLGSLEVTVLEALGHLVKLHPGGAANELNVQVPERSQAKRAVYSSALPQQRCLKVTETRIHTLLHIVIGSEDLETVPQQLPLPTKAKPTAAQTAFSCLSVCLCVLAGQASSRMTMGDVSLYFQLLLGLGDTIKSQVLCAPSYPCPAHLSVLLFSMGSSRSGSQLGRVSPGELQRWGVGVGHSILWSRLLTT